jgi:hypothetical protein
MNLKVRKGTPESKPVVTVVIPVARVILTMVTEVLVTVFVSVPNTVAV